MMDVGVAQKIAAELNALVQKYSRDNPVELFVGCLHAAVDGSRSFENTRDQFVSHAGLAWDAAEAALKKTG
jgi:hypothetical protein